MLPAVHRLRRAGDFRHALRAGGRAGSRLLVLHWAGDVATDDAVAVPARVGFIVSRSVGTAVVRTRVKRRLRHQMTARLQRLQPGASYVVRANPAAAAATSTELGAALDQCLATSEANRSR